MHTEENTTPENPFWAEALSEIADHWRAYLGQDWGDYYFVRRIWEDFIIHKIITLEDSDISDRMYDDFDDHEAWVNAVRNGDTDESYDSWRQDIDIFEECDAEDYYSCPETVVKILYDLWLWAREDDANDHNWYYLDDYQTYTMNTDLIENTYRRLETSRVFNQKLWDDIEKKFGINQMEFLAAEPIR